MGSAGLRVRTTLTGSGTVKGSVTNEGVVTGGLTVTGSYTQGAKGELVLRGGALKVGGAVRLAGALDLAAVAAGSGALVNPVRTIAVLNNVGRAKTTGAFSGLKEGAALKLADTTYRISYRGGDGNDVVLTAVAKGASPKAGAGAGARSGSGAAGSDSVAAADASTNSASAADSSGLVFWPYAMAVGLLAGLMIPAARRVRGRGNGRRRGGRHAAQG